MQEVVGELSSCTAPKLYLEKKRLEHSSSQTCTQEYAIKSNMLHCLGMDIGEKFVENMFSSLISVAAFRYRCYN